MAVVHCFLRWGDGFAVDVYVFELEAEGVADGETAFGFDVDVFECDVTQGALGEAG